MPEDQRATRRILVPRECNLSEYLATTLSKTNQHSLVFERDIQVGKDVVHQRWAIEAGRYGLPQPFDQDVAFAIWWFYQRQGTPDSGDITCTEAEFLDALRKPKGGSYYQMLHLALKRLLTCTIVSEEAILDIQSGIHLTDEFHFLIRYARDNRKKVRTRDRRIYLSIYKFFVASYKAGYVHLLDFDKYFSLTRPLAKRLYGLIDKMMGAKNTFEIGFERIVHILPVAARKRCKMLRDFQPSFEQLIAAECFSDIQVVPAKSEPYKIVFKRSAKQQIEVIAPSPDEVLRQIDLKRVPIFLGVNQVFLAAMVRKHGAERVQRTLEDLDRHYTRSGKTITSHEGLISRALESATPLGPVPLPEVPATSLTPGSPETDGELGEIVRRFYRELGVVRLSDQKLRDGIDVLERIEREAGVEIPMLNRIVDWVLANRAKKFPNLHSIRILLKAWDQALAEIERAQNAEKAALREKEAAEEKVLARKKREVEEVAGRRASLTDEEKSALRREAEQHADQNWFLQGQLEKFTSDAERQACREEYIRTAENMLLLGRVAIPTP